jgi:metal-responsive CopG/Arc/MetJ family transcriptional regulator
MKTAISVPDATFSQVTERALRLGWSRSEFFTRAAQRYLEQLDNDVITQQLNAVADAMNDDSSTRSAVSAGRRLLSTTDTW